MPRHIVRTRLGSMTTALSLLLCIVAPSFAVEDIPIACKLSAKDMQTRKQGVEAELFASISRVTELDNGYTLWFPREEGQLAKISHFVEAESECCAFLTFAVRLEAGGEEIAVDLTGPEGTKEVLEPLVAEAQPGG